MISLQVLKNYQDNISNHNFLDEYLFYLNRLKSFNGNVGFNLPCYIPQLLFGGYNKSLRKNKNSLSIYTENAILSSHKYAFRKLPIHVSEERLAKFSSIKQAKFNRAASMQHTVLDFEMLWREKKRF